MNLQYTRFPNLGLIYNARRVDMPINQSFSQSTSQMSKCTPPTSLFLFLPTRRQGLEYADSIPCRELTSILSNKNGVLDRT